MVFISFTQKLKGLTVFFTLCNLPDVFDAIFKDTGFEKLYLELFQQISRMSESWFHLSRTGLNVIFDRNIPGWKTANATERYFLCSELPNAIIHTKNEWFGNVFDVVVQTFRIVESVWTNLDSIIGSDFMNPNYVMYWHDFAGNISSSQDLAEFMQKGADFIGLEADVSIFGNWMQSILNLKNESWFVTFETMYMLSEIAVYESEHIGVGFFDRIEEIFTGNHLGLFSNRLESLIQGSSPQNWTSLFEDVAESCVSPFIQFVISANTKVYQDCSRGMPASEIIYEAGLDLAYEIESWFSEWRDIKNSTNRFPFQDLSRNVSVFENFIVLYENVDSLAPLYLENSRVIDWIETELFYTKYQDAKSIYDIFHTTLFLPLDIIVDVIDVAVQLIAVFKTDDAVPVDTYYIIDTISKLFANEAFSNSIKRLTTVIEEVMVAVDQGMDAYSTFTRVCSARKW